MTEPTQTQPSASTIAAYIDQTLLRADATGPEIDALVDSALKYRFAAVCVNPVWVHRVALRLARTGIAIASVIDFPLGASSPAGKAHAARIAIEDGATEIDMVIDIGAAKGADWERVAEGVREVVAVAHDRGVRVKAILETSLLTPVEIERATRVCSNADVDFVKTSTGFSTRGASVEDVRLMKSAAGPAVRVKASGGIRTAADARAMIEAGADRIGTSGGVAIVEGWDAPA